jgi:hypothetical protein
LKANHLKIHQKNLKFSLRGLCAVLPFAHRKIVLGGTTARRSHRLRRAVFFPACPDAAALPILILGRRPVFR